MYIGFKTGSLNNNLAVLVLNKWFFDFPYKTLSLVFKFNILFYFL